MWSSNWPSPSRYPWRALGIRCGALLIDSMPPASTTSADPARNMSCASMAAFMPEPHILLRVVACTSVGSPAPSTAWRAGACPSPANRQHPISASCAASGCRPACRTAAASAWAPSCGAL
ncbi:Uncharacterised protein [Bordetella pertussis]|nr:Uncharacterised protein [Bordetella pertussis]